MTAQPQKKKITPTEYLAHERSYFDIKHEFFDGELFDMVGAKKNHIYINANLAGELRNKFKTDNSTCKAVSNDMRMKISDNYIYPDIHSLW